MERDMNTEFSHCFTVDSDNAVIRLYPTNMRALGASDALVSQVWRDCEVLATVLSAETKVLWRVAMAESEVLTPTPTPTRGPAFTVARPEGWPQGWHNGVWSGWSVQMEGQFKELVTPHGVRGIVGVRIHVEGDKVSVYE